MRLIVLLLVCSNALAGELVRPIIESTAERRHREVVEAIEAAGHDDAPVVYFVRESAPTPPACPAAREGETLECWRIRNGLDYNFNPDGSPRR